MPWWLRWTRRRLDEDDLQEEFRSHLRMAADDRVADGADRRGAELDSLKDFGNIAHAREARRRVWTPRWLELLHDQASDVRYAVRALAKNPVFSLTVVGVLALGIDGARGDGDLRSHRLHGEAEHARIGIRMALGASNLSVVRGFVARGLRLGAMGAGLGLTAALAVTRLLSSALFGVSATDVSSFARALAIVISVVVVATLVPAWRASQMNPLSALRHE